MRPWVEGTRWHDGFGISFSINGVCVCVGDVCVGCALGCPKQRFYPERFHFPVVFHFWAGLLFSVLALPLHKTGRGRGRVGQGA